AYVGDGFAPPGGNLWMDVRDPNNFAPEGVLYLGSIDDSLDVAQLIGTTRFTGASTYASVVINATITWTSGDDIYIPTGHLQHLRGLLYGLGLTITSPPLIFLQLVGFALLDDAGLVSSLPQSGVTSLVAVDGH